MINLQYKSNLINYYNKIVNFKPVCKKLKYS